MSAAFPWLVIAAAALAALVAMLRLWRHARRHRLPLLLLQPLAAAALAAALLLPAAPGPRRVHVLTDGADAAAVPAGAAAVRLPGAAQADDVPTWPDLATLLRAQPQIASLVVHGHGLDADDLAAAGDRPIRFQPAPAPQGIVALDAPLQVRAGARFTLRGRVRTNGETMLRLLDPAGGVHAEATPAADGRFALDAVAPAPGRHPFRMVLLADAQPLQALPVAIAAVAPAPQQGLLLAAAPSAELRALRRWAADAGLQLDARITLAPGLPLQDAPLRLDAATLAATDLLILDERSWPAGSAERRALREAVAGGMGLLLRVTGPLPAAVIRDLQALASGAAEPGGATAPGLLAAAAAGEAPAPVVLTNPHTANGAAVDPAVQPAAVAVELHAWPVAFAADAAPLLSAEDGRLLAAWRPVGNGRIGVLALADTHRLQARAGRSDYATLWSQLWGRLARGGEGASLTVASAPRPGHRTAVCGAADGAVAIGPDGTARRLLRDPATPGCAAWYPLSPGWHRLQAGTATRDVHVPETADIETLLQEARRTATAARASGRASQAAERADAWPWRPLLLAAWLLLLALGWLLERRAQASAARTPAGQGAAPA